MAVPAGLQEGLAELGHLRTVSLRYGCPLLTETLGEQFVVYPSGLNLKALYVRVYMWLNVTVSMHTEPLAPSARNRNPSLPR
jgi:hypothetical protein